MHFKGAAGLEWTGLYMEPSIDGEFGPRGFKIRKNSRILYFF